MSEGVKISNISLNPELSVPYGEVDGLSLQNIFYAKNGYFPMAYMFTQSQCDKMIDTVGLSAAIDAWKEDTERIYYHNYDVDTGEERVGFSIIFNNHKVYARFEENVSECYILYGNEDEEYARMVKDTMIKFYKERKRDENNLYSLAQDKMGFHLETGHVCEVKDFSIEEQYNDDFKDIDGIIKDFLDEKGKSGLVILHGEKGTGKTTYIRHLINTYHDYKFISISPNLLPLLGDTSFASFLQTNMRDSIVILEDCESAISDRKTGSSGGAVSLLLNLSDGLVGDNLGIKFICTFNAETKTIDPALMRKGRLWADYEFKALSEDKTITLVNKVIENKKTELDAKINELSQADLIDEDKIMRLKKKKDKLNEISGYHDRVKLTLADIYNIDEVSFQKERTKISF